MAASVACAIEPLHRVNILAALRYQAWTDNKIPFPFISEMDLRRDVGMFPSNSGVTTLLAAPLKIVSIYDATSTAYDLKSYYTAQNIRAHLILNYFIPDTPILLSAGYDSGSKAQKISISPTKFIGLSSYKRINSNSAIFFMAGGWQRERITETPCVDSYEREYWCANLSAWSDHTPLTSNAFRFIDIKYEFKF
jgi:hypothetical protein